MLLQKGSISNTSKVVALVIVQIMVENGGTNWFLKAIINEFYLPFWSNIYELKFWWEANGVPIIQNHYD